MVHHGYKGPEPVLGLFNLANRLNTHSLQTLRTAVDHTLPLIGHVSNKHGGLRESELLRLVQAFVLSKITYSLPYLHLSHAEIDTVDILLRRVHKYALGIPSNASTERLLRTGILNTLSELVEAHLTSQYARLVTTNTGRHILQSLPAKQRRSNFALGIS